MRYLWKQSTDGPDTRIMHVDRALTDSSGTIRSEDLASVHGIERCFVSRYNLAALFEAERLLPPEDRPEGVSAEARLGLALRRYGPFATHERSYSWDAGSGAIRRGPTEATARRTTEPLPRVVHSEVYPRSYTP